MSGCCPTSLSCSLDPKGKGIAPREWLKLGLALVVAAQAMIFGVAVNLAEPEHRVRMVLHLILAISVMIVFVICGFSLCKVAWSQMMEKRVSIEQMFLIGILGAFATSLYSSLRGHGAVYYEVVAVLLAVYTLGNFIGRHKRAQAIELAGRLGAEYQICRVLTTEGVELEKNYSDVMPGDMVVLRPGEGVPVDGRIKEGIALVSDTPLTGEPFPVRRHPGERILAGSHVLDGRLVIETMSSSENRQLDRLIERLQNACNRPSTLQREADRIMTWFMPTVMGLALCTFVFWGWHADWETGLLNALAVVVVACPCAMGLATPIAIWGGVHRLASWGIMVDTGEWLERLARVDTVVFDKTGTLSEERLRVVDLECVEGVAIPELKRWVRLAQEGSSHPIAAAMRDWAREDEANGVKDDSVVVQSRAIPGCGIEVVLRCDSFTRTIAIGNRHLLESSERTVFDRLLKNLTTEREECREVVVLENGHLVAVGWLYESLRESAKNAIGTLEKMALRVEIMTGDHSGSVQNLGLRNAKAGMLPAEKADQVALLQKMGRRVLFVGDGMNDAAAAAQAEVGLALSSGANITREAAHATLAGGNLMAIPRSVRMARKVVKEVRRNLFFAAVYNALGVSLAVMGVLHPVVAVVLMMFSSIMVTWRATLFLEKMDEGDSEIESRNFQRHSRRKWTGNQSVGLAWTCGISTPLLLVLLASNARWTGWMWWSMLGIGLIAGVMMVRMLPRASSGEWGMSLWGMLTIGNIGMILGWMADSGWGWIVQSNGVHCNCGNALLQQGWLSLSWMQIGMVIATFPVVFVDARKNGYPWIPSFLTCSVGMLVGMHLVSKVMAILVIPQPVSQFFLIFGVMTTGMTLGMALTHWTFLQWKRLCSDDPVIPGKTPIEELWEVTPSPNESGR